MLLVLILLDVPVRAAEVSYNLKDYQTPLTTRVSLPGDWHPGPAPDYLGSLDAYWWAVLGPGEKVLVSETNARQQGLPQDFTLSTAPDNCWGMFMGFGLVTLSQPADLRIRIRADQTRASAVVPAFAVYQGWDLGSESSRHLTIAFGTDNPLGTQGLFFLADSYSENLGTEASTTLSSLPAGPYEVFVTSRGNTTSNGAYEVELEAFAPGSQPRPSLTHLPLCGPAADQPLALSEVPADLLCRYGKPKTALSPLKDGRLTWLCGGAGLSRDTARCYSQGQDKRLNQAPLMLTADTAVVSLGQTIPLKAEGGSGSGKLSFVLAGASHGTRCQLKTHGATATLRLLGVPGACRIIARKRGDRAYHETESAPLEIRLDR